MAGGFVDELPVVVAPVRGLGQGTAYRDGDAFAGEAEQHGRRGQRGVDPGGEAGGVHVGRGAFQRVVDLQDGLVRFEEEVTRDPHVLEPPLLDAEVHDHELAPGDLVLTVHCATSGPGRRFVSGRFVRPRSRY